MQYEGKVCVITGAASGIGRALAAELCGRGATVVLSDIDGSAADAAATQLRATGARAESEEVDVTDAGAVAAVVENAVEKHGRLDLIFNNAGIAVTGDARDLSLAHWRRVIDVNLMGVVYGSDAAYKVMARQGHGHI
ncbi:MAG: SDR family oxidoreductase, partial [Gammaproteobacteria bacterium]